MTKQVIRREARKDFWERNRRSGGYLLKKRVLDVLYRFVRVLLLFGMCFLILQPLITKVAVSFMAERDLYNPIVVTIPENFTTSNYRLAALLLEYGSALWNTFRTSLLVALLQISMCTLVGYGFARFNFPLKKLWFGCVVMMIIVPPQTLSTSLYMYFRHFDILGVIKAIRGSDLNLQKSSLPYYMMSMGCMGLKNGLYIYMIRQFFRNIPKDLEEAAYVDGCGTLKTFIRIMLPDAKPILTSCFLFSFVWQWTDNFYTKLFMGNMDLLAKKVSALVDTLNNYVINTLKNSSGVSMGYGDCILSTGTLMMITPLLLLYLFAQKGFVESLSSTGIKM